MTAQTVFNSLDNLLSGVENTLISYNNSTGKVQFLNQFTFEGDAKAIFRVYLNNDLIARRRITSSKPSYSFPFYDVSLGINDLIEVKGEHFEDGMCQLSAFFQFSDTISQGDGLDCSVEVSGEIENKLVLGGEVVLTNQLSGGISSSVLSGELIYNFNLEGGVVNNSILSGEVLCN